MASPFPFSSGQVLTAAQLNSIGEYSDYTPSFTNISFSSYTARYAIVNEMMHVWFSGVLDATVSGTVEISAPVATQPTSTHTLMSGVCFALDDNTSLSYYGVVRTVTADEFTFISTTDAVGVSTNTWDAAAPFTWASGDLLSFNVVVEAS